MISKKEEERYRLDMNNDNFNKRDKVWNEIKRLQQDIKDLQESFEHTQKISNEAYTKAETVLSMTRPIGGTKY